MLLFDNSSYNKSHLFHENRCPCASILVREKYLGAYQFFPHMMHICNINGFDENLFSTAARCKIYNVIYLN